jgi:acyl-lipid omega-6 desaturase (Delta-12 desaturase)
MHLSNQTDILVNITPNTASVTIDARRWTQILSRYREPSPVRSIAELTVTVLPLVALWSAAWFAFSLGHLWASLLMAIPTAGFLVRLFMIQHDCGHGAFFYLDEQTIGSAALSACSH